MVLPVICKKLCGQNGIDQELGDSFGEVNVEVFDVSVKCFVSFDIATGCSLKRVTEYCELTAQCSQGQGISSTQMDWWLSFTALPMINICTTWTYPKKWTFVCTWYTCKWNLILHILDWVVKFWIMNFNVLMKIRAMIGIWIYPCYSMYRIACVVYA